MLRSTSLNLLARRCYQGHTRNKLSNVRTMAPACSKSWNGGRGSSSLVLAQQRRRQIEHSIHSPSSLKLMLGRSLSTAKKDETTTKKADGSDGGDEESTKEIVLTPGEKVVVASRLTMWAGIFGLACVCAYYIGKELIPTKMSPNRVFDRALAIVKENEQVKRRYGDKIKGYGRDHGGHREGRRNFIEHTQYKDEQDGSNRTRVRFNLEGEFGNAFVFAEVSSAMPSGEFVYVLVQDKSNGRVQTIIDNRSALTAARLAGGNKEQMAAMSQLLGGGGGKS